MSELGYRMLYPFISQLPVEPPWTSMNLLRLQRHSMRPVITSVASARGNSPPPERWTQQRLSGLLLHLQTWVKVFVKENHAIFGELMNVFLNVHPDFFLWGCPVSKGQAVHCVLRGTINELQSTTAETATLSTSLYIDSPEFTSMFIMHTCSNGKENSVPSTNQYVSSKKRNGDG